MLTGRGLPASDPSVWSADTVAEFGSLTAHYMQAFSAASGREMSVVNTIGDPCVGGVFFPGCKGLMSPNMSAVAPILSQPKIDGMFW